MSSLTKRSYVLFYVLILGLFATLITLANLDLTHGRYVLFMDEWGTFDGTKHILDSKSLKELLYNTLNVGPFMYGKILQSSSALFAYLPYKIYGTPALIFTIRATQAIFLFLSYLVLIFGFLRSNLLRITALLCLCALPYTAYYSTMPKPDPLMLLFLCLFLFYAAKNKFKLDLYWIFIGLSLGSKISAAPALLLSVALSLYFNGIPNVSQCARAFSGLWLGLLLSNPVSIWGANIWVRNTFLAAGHGADDSRITFVDWILQFYQNFIMAPSFFKILFYSALPLFSIVLLWNDLRHKTIKQLIHENILLIYGFGMAFAIIVPVKRIWFMYLHPSLCLLVLGLFSLFERHWKRSKKLSYVTFFIFCGFVYVFVLPKTLSKFYALAHRSDEQGFQNKLARHDKIKHMLEKISDRLGRRVVVYHSPEFVPDESPKLVAEPVFGFFKYENIETNKDVLVEFGPYIYLPGEESLPVTALEKKLETEAIALRQNYFFLDIERCKKKKYCYVLLRNGGLNFYINQNIYNEVRSLFL